MQRPTPHLQGLRELNLRPQERGYPERAGVPLEGSVGVWPSDLPSSSASTRTPSPGAQGGGPVSGRRWSGVQGQAEGIDDSPDFEPGSATYPQRPKCFSCKMSCANGPKDVFLALS